jgi:hypothetical protein
LGGDRKKTLLEYAAEARQVSIDSHTFSASMSSPELVVEIEKEVKAKYTKGAVDDAKK